MRGYTISIWRLGSGAVSAILEGIALQGAAHESRPDRLRTACRTPAEARFRERRRALRPRAPRPKLLVHGPTALHDLRPSHGPRQPARDRHVSAGHRTALLPMRHSRPGVAQHLV